MREAVDEDGLDFALDIVRDDHGEDETLDAAGDERLSVDVLLAEVPHERVDDQRADLGHISRAWLDSAPRTYSTRNCGGQSELHPNAHARLSSRLPSISQAHTKRRRTDLEAEVFGEQRRALGDAIVADGLVVVLEDLLGLGRQADPVG